MLPTDPVELDIIKARVRVYILKPFLGHLISALDCVEVTQPWCRTAATDGRYIYWSRPFFVKLNHEQIKFVLAHEVYHVLFQHLGRRGNRDKDYWNMAGDYFINYSLKHEGFELIEGVLYDEQYTDDMSVYEIYDILKKNSVTIVKPFDDHLDLGDDDTRDFDEISNDNVPDLGEEESGSGGKQAKITIFGKDGPPRVSAEDLAKIESQMRNAMIQAMQSHGAGSVPKGLKRMIDDLLEPQLDWRTMLDSFTRSQMKGDYTLMKLPRREYMDGIIMPVLAQLEAIEADVYFDASGSTTQEMITEMLSETVGICEEFHDYDLRVSCFDTKVYNTRHFNLDNRDEVAEYKKDFVGGGGTHFECVFDHLRSEGRVPKRLIIFTDGLPNMTWGEDSYCDVLFIIHGDPKIVAPFGTTAHYDDHRKKPMKLAA